MAFRAGVGVSSARNPAVAAREAVAAARERSGIDLPDLVILFSTVGYDQAAILSTVRAETGRAPLVGCSVEGIISAESSIEDGFAVEVTLLKSDEVRFHTAAASTLKEAAEAAGAKIGEALKPALGDDALALVVFPDGLTFNFDAFHRGLKETLAPTKFLPILGGTSGDDWAFKKTYQYKDDELLADGVVAALLSGSLRLAVAVNHGCIPLGSERTITKTRDNVILEIDGKPALDVLAEYLDIEERDDWSRVSINLPFGFKAPDFLRDQDDLVIRYLMSKDNAEKSVTIGTKVEAGTKVWMTRRDLPKIGAGLDRAVVSLREQMGSAAPKLVFNFDCAGRGKVFMRNEEKQRLLQKVRAALAPEAPWLGFHAYGEIAPVGPNNSFHNFTAVLATLY